MRERLDVLLVDRGLFATRAQARAAVLAGEITVDGSMVDKPGTQVDETAVLEAAARSPLRLARRRQARHGAHPARRRRDRGRRHRPRQLHRRVRRPAAAGRRRPRDRGRRRVRAARLEAARGPARHGARAHQRPPAHARTSPLRAVVRHRRPVLHLPDGRSGPGARMPARGLPRPRAGQAAVRGGARAGRQGRGGQGPGRPRGRARAGGAVAAGKGRRVRGRLRLGASGTERQRGVLHPLQRRDDRRGGCAAGDRPRERAVEAVHG